MYKNPGHEIKSWAKFLVIASMIPAALIGIAVFCYLAGDDQGILGFLIGAVIIGVAYFFSRLGYILLYAYGEITECLTAINEKLESNPKSNNNAKNLHQESCQKPKTTSDEPWTCRECGNTNKPNTWLCAKCFKAR